MAVPLERNRTCTALVFSYSYWGGLAVMLVVQPEAFGLLGSRITGLDCLQQQALRITVLA